MDSEDEILQAICAGLKERFERLRFEETSRRKGEVATEIYVKRAGAGDLYSTTKFELYKHVCFLGLSGDYLLVIPGNLMRHLPESDFKLELANPASIDKLIALLEDCCENPVPAADVCR